MDKWIKKLMTYPINFPYGEFNDVKKVYELSEGTFIVNRHIEGTFEVYYGTKDLVNLMSGLKEVKKEFPVLTIRYGKPYLELLDLIPFFEAHQFYNQKIHVAYKLNLSMHSFRQQEDLTIVRLEEHDIDELMQLEQSIFYAYHVDEEDYMAWVKQDDYMIMVLKDNNQIIGFIIMQFYGDNNDQCFIRNLAIKETYRKRKLGQSLLEHALSIALKRGANKSMLWVEHGNKPAIQLYEKYGYTRDDEECEAVFISK